MQSAMALFRRLLLRRSKISTVAASSDLISGRNFASESWPEPLPPHQDTARVSSDGSCHWRPIARAGAGFWIRAESTGTFVHAWNKMLLGKLNYPCVELAEHNGCCNGIAKAVDLGYKSIILETDSESLQIELKKCLKKGYYPTTPEPEQENDKLTHQKILCYAAIKRLLNSIPTGIQIKICKIKREKNPMADFIAGLGRGEEVPRSYNTFEELKKRYKERQASMAKKRGQKPKTKMIMPKMNDKKWDEYEKLAKGIVRGEDHEDEEFIQWNGLRGSSSSSRIKGAILAAWIKAKGNFG